jgi:hypothetical protein
LFENGWQKNEPIPNPLPAGLLGTFPRSKQKTKKIEIEDLGRIELEPAQFLAIHFNF